MDAREGGRETEGTWVDGAVDGSGVTLRGVYIWQKGDGCIRMRTRTAMLEISWLPRSLEGADASFWPASNVFVYFPGLRASFCFWVRGLTLFYIYVPLQADFLAQREAGQKVLSQQMCQVGLK